MHASLNPHACFAVLVATLLKCLGKQAINKHLISDNQRGIMSMFEDTCLTLTINTSFEDFVQTYNYF